MKTSINSEGVVVRSTGSGLDIDSTISMNSLPIASISTKDLPGTITLPGVYNLNYDVQGTWVMPLASSVPGGIFIFKTVDGYNHNLTGSQENSGTKVFAGMSGATPDNQGSKLTLSTGTNMSVSLISDGKSFLVMAASGSCVISGT